MATGEHPPAAGAKTTGLYLLREGKRIITGNDISAMNDERQLKTILLCLVYQTQ